MLLQFPNGDSFATGAICYDYRPVSGVETTNRLILPVEIEGVLTEAVVDTGAPYVICAPGIARLAGFNSAYALERLSCISSRSCQSPMKGSDRKSSCFCCCGDCD